MKLPFQIVLGLALTLPAPLFAQAALPEALALPRAQFIVEMDAEFRKLDIDGDGTVLGAEIEESQRRLAASAAVARFDHAFKQLDKDKDGRLSPSEFRALAATETKPAVDPKPTLARFDANRDGKIALVEYRTATQANFDRVDSDRDGTISAQELKAARVVN